MDVQVGAAGIEEKSVLRQLIELYKYDFSEWDGADLDRHGLFGYRYLDHYWTDADRFPFLIRAEGKLAGFALLRRKTRLLGDETGMAVAEFFILRKYRREGVGRQSAVQLFDRFPGRWEVAETAENVAAQAFWRKVIAEYTSGRFSETWLNDERWHGPIQSFDISGHAPPRALRSSPMNP